MKYLKILAIALFASVMFSGCMPIPNPTTQQNPQQPGQSGEEDLDLLQLKEYEEGMETAVITTNHGTITMVLFEKEAPNTVKHFKKLIKEGFYNSKKVFLQDGMKAFVSGAETENGSKGKVDPEFGKKLKSEPSKNLWHFSGAVSVLGWEKGFLNKKVYADSRFFILGDVEATEESIKKMEEFSYPKEVIDAYKEKGGMPQFTGAFTVFGQVVEGMDVVNKISTLEINKDTATPVDGTIVEKIELSTYKKNK